MYSSMQDKRCISKLIDRPNLSNVIHASFSLNITTNSYHTDNNTPFPCFQPRPGRSNNIDLFLVLTAIPSLSNCEFIEKKKNHPQTSHDQLNVKLFISQANLNHRKPMIYWPLLIPQDIPCIPPRPWLGGPVIIWTGYILFTCSAPRNSFAQPITLYIYAKVGLWGYK
jgi:hypothetical protein